MKNIFKIITLVIIVFSVISCNVEGKINEPITSKYFEVNVTSKEILDKFTPKFDYQQKIFQVVQDLLRIIIS